MKMLLKLREKHVTWMDEKESPPYSFNLFKIQASALALVVVPMYFITIVFFGYFTIKSILIASVIWVALSFIVWLGQSDQMKIAEKNRLRFVELCESPQSISEYFLADTSGGKTVLGIIYNDGKKDSFFEGVEAIEAHSKIKKSMESCGLEV